MIEVKTQQYNGHSIATAFHDAGEKSIVIFCHGYRSTSVGPNRFFVRASNALAELGVSSLRFDQYGCGNSEGDFYDSSFNDWVATTKAIAQDYIVKGYTVSLFGQSMGGSTVLVAASELPDIKCVVAWVPDASVNVFNKPESGYMEESGQRVQSAYWQEAHEARIAEKIALVQAPAYIVQCTDDEYVDEKNRAAISNNAQSNHVVKIFDGYSHSRWSYDQAEEIIQESVNFITNHIDSKP